MTTPTAMVGVAAPVGVTAPEPRIALMVKNRFLRSVPETVGTYRHNGKHVQGALRRRILWLFFSEKYSSLNLNGKNERPDKQVDHSSNNQKLFVSMSASLNDEEMFYMKHANALLHYKKHTMKYLKGMRSFIAGGTANQYHDDTFGHVQILLRDERMICRNELKKMFSGILSTIRHQFQLF